MIQPDLENGMIWLIDKPYEWTSFDVIRKLKYALIRLTGNKKVKIGHAGTLDPLATGLLLVCVGKATKKIDSLQAGIKEYTGVITLGATTPSYDKETAVSATFPFETITSEEILDVSRSFIGLQQQVAPVYSAKMVDGKRLYTHARAGSEVEIKSHAVEIFEFEITRIQLPDIHFRIVCSKGTYIRSIARDFGLKLNNGAYLSVLRRTRSGEFTVEQAKPLPELWRELTGEEFTERPAGKRNFLYENRKDEGLTSM